MNSREMVNVMRVQREWLDIIDTNRALWRRLILPEKRSGWSPAIVEQFDRKSHSSLREVSMEVKYIPNGPESIVRTLEKSKETLRIVRIQDVNYDSRKILSTLSWKLPNLVDCRITDKDQRLVRFIQKNPNQDLEDQGSRLRVLWSPVGKLPLPLPLRQIMTGLVSLSLEYFHRPSEWMQILNEISAETLKHLVLTITILYPWEEIEDTTLSIELPNLEVLETKHVGVNQAFPSWIKLGPSFSSLICYNNIYSSIPSVSTLWIRELGVVRRLANSCPELVELRVMEARYLTGQNVSELIAMLKQRRRNVEEGTEIEGVKMVQLKRLLIEFSEVGSSELQEMEHLVEGVLNLSSAPPVELEI